MGKVLNPFYRLLEIFTQFILLNILWILFCLPIITIFSSTTAMYGVARKWVTKDIDYNIVKPFWTMFKANLIQGIILQSIWMIVAGFLIIDFLIVFNNEFVGKQVVWGILLLAIMIFIMMTIYLFPMLVHYQLSIRHTLKNSFLMSIGALGSTVLCILSVLVIITLSYFFPVVLLFFGSIMAYMIFHICNRSFQKVRFH